jgi:hypothetical protein
MEFDGEMAIHFPGRKGLNTPPIFSFPKLVVCLKCGFMRCSISPAELRQVQDSAGSVEEIAL